MGRAIHKDPTHKFKKLSYTKDSKCVLNLPMAMLRSLEWKDKDEILIRIMPDGSIGLFNTIRTPKIPEMDLDYNLHPAFIYEKRKNKKSKKVKEINDSEEFEKYISTKKYPSKYFVVPKTPKKKYERPKVSKTKTK